LREDLEPLLQRVFRGVDLGFGGGLELHERGPLVDQAFLLQARGAAEDLARGLKNPVGMVAADDQVEVALAKLISAIGLEKLPQFLHPENAPFSDVQLAVFPSREGKAGLADGP
jgi:hypothetical protein